LPDRADRVITLRDGQVVPDERVVVAASAG
jgi:hypothetical protein